MVNLLDPEISIKRAQQRITVGSHTGIYPWLADVKFAVQPVDSSIMIQGETFYEPRKWKEVTHVHYDGSIINSEPLNGAGDAYRLLYAGSTRENRDEQYACGFLQASDGSVIAPVGVPCMHVRFLHEVDRDGWHYDTARVTYVYAWREPDERVVLLAHGLNMSAVAYRDYYTGVKSWLAGLNNFGYGIPSFDTWDDAPTYTSKVWPPDVTDVTRFVMKRYFDRWGPGGSELDRAVRPIPQTTLTNPLTLRPASKRFMVADDLKSHCRHFQQIAVNQANQLLWSVRPELDANAFDKVEKFDGNLGLFAQKVLATPLGLATINSLAEFARNPPSRKSIASLWLATRYGDRLGFSGLKSLVEAIDKQLGYAYYLHPKPLDCRNHTFGTLPGFYGEARCAVQMVVQNDDSTALLKLMRLAQEWDAWPTLQNVWDAIPLSFVLDWFTGFGNTLQSIDRMVQSRYYNVDCIMESIKALLHDPVVPELTLSVYMRRNGGPLHLGVSSISLGLPSTINCISGTALLCG